MPLEFINSEKGRPRLVSKGFLYHRDSEQKGVTYWRCIHQRNASDSINHCPGRAVTSNDEITKETEHNHSGEASLIAKEQIVDKMKDVARTSTKSGHEIIAQTSASISESVVPLLPSTSSLKRAFRHIRSAQENHPEHPMRREDIVLPPQFCETEKNANFLLYDKGQNEDRILIFGTDENLSLLATANHWFADGTFDACTTLFAQLYTIHAMIEDRIVPLIYVLLPGKSEQTYRETFQQLKNINPELQPTSVLIDMERAAAQAFVHVFPEVTIRFCNFHFNQAVYRKLASHNLKTRYDTDMDFANKIKHFSALAFVPVEDVENLYDRIVDEIFDSPDKDTDDFIFSFEEQYIGRTDRRGVRRGGKFPISFWNHYESCQDLLPRTNNNIEGWHRGFNELVRQKKPTLWQLLTSLKSEQSRNELVMAQIRNAVPGEPQKKKYKNLNEQLISIVKGYDKPLYNNKMDYLRAIANHLSL